MNMQAEKINKSKVWIMASRPRTLLAAFVPVIVGTSVAFYESKVNLLAAFIALVCSILIQVGTNFVNDLYDYLSGADSINRKGPKRVLVSGLISVSEMKFAILFVFGTTFILGIYLVYISSYITLLIGIFSIIAGIVYTAGPFPLAYNGLGDIFVFLFFGIIGTVGTYYVQAVQFSNLSFWAAIPVGALITNILVVNNYRDIEEDKLAKKNTLAVILGKAFSRYQFLFLFILSFIILFIIYFYFKQSLFVFLPVISLPLVIKVVRMIFTFEGEKLNKTLELTAKLSAIFGLLLAIGIVL